MAMSMTPYRELSLLDRMIDRAFSDMLRTGAGETTLTQWSPAVDIKEDTDKYVVTADIPGVDPKEIEISFEDGVLSISGERKTEERSENKEFSRVERVYGKFSRQFRLPESADEEHIRASGKNGVLEVEIPKKERAKPRRIEVGN